MPENNDFDVKWWLRQGLAVLVLVLLICLFSATVSASLAAICGVVLGYCLLRYGYQVGWGKASQNLTTSNKKKRILKAIAYMCLGLLLLASSLFGFAGFSLIAVFGHGLAFGVVLTFSMMVLVMLLACILISPWVPTLFDEKSSTVKSIVGLLVFVFSAFCLISMIAGLNTIIHFALSAPLWLMVPFIAYNVIVAAFCLYVCIRAIGMIFNLLGVQLWGSKPNNTSKYGSDESYNLSPTNNPRSVPGLNRPNDNNLNNGGKGYNLRTGSTGTVGKRSDSFYSTVDGSNNKSNSPGGKMDQDLPLNLGDNKWGSYFEVGNGKDDPVTTTNTGNGEVQMVYNTDGAYGNVNFG